MGVRRRLQLHLCGLLALAVLLAAVLARAWVVGRAALGVLWGGPLVVLAALWGQRLVRSVTEPLVTLTTAAASLAAGHFDLPPTVAGDGELGELASVLATLATTLRARLRDLADSREHLRITLQSIGDAVIATDTDGCITQLNPVAEALTGWSTGEAAGRPLPEVFRIIDADTGERAANPVDTVLREGRTVGLANHTLLLARDGVQRQIADSAAPIRTDRDEIVGVVLVFRDVTTEYAHDQALRESEARFRVVFEQAGVGVALLECASGRLLRVNQHFCDTTGRAAAELLGATVYEFIHPADAPARQAQGARLLAGDCREFSLEQRFVRPDGEVRWVHATISPMWSPGQRPADCIAVVQDITERRAAVARLAESEARFRQLFADAPLGLATTGPDYLIRTTNAAYCRFLGYEPDEMHGMTFRDFTLPDQVGGDETGLRELISGQRAVYHTEKRYRRKDGEIVWGAATVTAIRDDQGALTELLAMVEDIGPRRAALAGLAESEERFRRAFADGPLGLVIVGEDLRFREANAAFCRFLGYSLDELRGLRFIEVTHPESREADEAAVRALLGGAGGLYATQKRYLRKDGRSVWGSLTVSSVLGRDGQVLYLLGMIEDISARVAAEEALKLREQDLVRAQAQARLGSWRWDARTDHAEWSDELYRLSGVEPAEFSGRREDIVAMVHPEDRPRLAQTIQQVIDQGGVEPFLYRIVRPDGVERVVRGAGWEAERDADGQLVRLLGTVQDVTEQEALAAALVASEARFRSLFASMVEGVALHELVCDADGQPCDYRLLDVNPAFERILGVRREEALGRLATELYGVAAAPYLDDYARVAQTGEPVTFVTHYPPLDRHFAISVASPAPGQFATIFEDITNDIRVAEERRRLEAQVQQAQKLESLGVLAGGIAHDFNNLLAAILGNADLALVELSPASPARGSLQAIEQASRRAAELCKQMLAYSGRGRFEVQPLDLAEVVTEMGHMLEVAISKKAVLKYHFGHGLPAVMADATQMRQVLMNLIINASEAIGDVSGVISVSTGITTCDRAYLDELFLDQELPEGLYVTLDVSDTGCGMDADTRARLFDPFFTTKFTGRGLGLAAVLGIVRGHRGAIKVYSEVGRGTTFRLLLPAAEEPAGLSRLDPSDASHAWRGSGHVLLVDDEESVRTVGERMLTHLGFTVVTAEDGQEAVEVFRRGPAEFALVVLDLTMPHLDGVAAFSELRRLRADVPIVVSSGYNEQEVTDQFAGKGLTGFVQKPYRLDALAEVVRRATN